MLLSISKIRGAIITVMTTDYHTVQVKWHFCDFGAVYKCLKLLV